MPDSTPTINTYISDMIALEQHMLKPLRSQADNEAVLASRAAARIVREAANTRTAHIAALESRLETLGGHQGAGVKTGVASVVGGIAAAVDNARKTEVSKDLRDDYAALCLASASYTMLHAAALGLRDQTTAELAKRHLADDASLIMRMSAAIPVVVLSELRDAGAAVDTSVATEAEKNAEGAWREGAARSGAGAEYAGHE